MESITYLKNVKIPPKKLRYLLDAIKKFTPAIARDHLLYGSTRSARILHKTLVSAIANAKSTLNTQEDLLKFKTLTVEEGTHMRRFRAGGRGTAKPIVKKTSHIKVILTVPELVSKPAESVNAEVKTEDAVVEKKAVTTKKTVNIEKVSDSEEKKVKKVVKRSTKKSTEVK